VIVHDALPSKTKSRLHKETAFVGYKKLRATYLCWRAVDKTIFDQVGVAVKTEVKESQSNAFFNPI